MQEQVSMEKEDLMAHQQKTSHQQRLNRMEQEKNMFVQSVGLADAPENVQSSNMLAENDQADDLLVFAEPLANKAESYGGYSDDNDGLEFISIQVNCTCSKLIFLIRFSFI